MPEGLLISHADGVVEVVVDHGDANLLTIHSIEELTRLLVDPPTGTHVVHIRAEGPNFCLGRERGAGDVDGLRRESEALVALNRALSDGPLVTVAEVNGAAAGFGAGLAALCDLSFAAPGASFWFPEINIDLAPAVVLAWLPRRIGRTQAFRLAATGAAIDAATAVSLGLITDVAPSDDALPKLVADEIATLRTRNPRVHREIKSFLQSTGDMSEAQAYRFALDRLVIGSLRRSNAVEHAAPATPTKETSNDA
ncbi:MAG: enoyl-CoA hydratase/isomerase family protein [Nitriliruptorales bacterium]|nr:enoyl-CoA hydratase/isomerase family protein [Nitriliruptorales bacterium]